MVGDGDQSPFLLGFVASKPVATPLPVGHVEDPHDYLPLPDQVLQPVVKGVGRASVFHAAWEAAYGRCVAECPAGYVDFFV